MGKVINTAKLIFVGIFIVAAAGIWAYQIYYVAPRLKCEEAHGWWSKELRRCETPILNDKYKGPRPPSIEEIERLHREGAAAAPAAATQDSGQNPAQAPAEKN